MILVHTHDIGYTATRSFGCIAPCITTNTSSSLYLSYRAWNLSFLCNSKTDSCFSNSIFDPIAFCICLFKDEILGSGCFIYLYSWYKSEDISFALSSTVANTQNSSNEEAKEASSRVQCWRVLQIRYVKGTFLISFTSSALAHSLYRLLLSRSEALSQTWMNDVYICIQ